VAFLDLIQLISDRQAIFMESGKPEALKSQPINGRSRFAGSITMNSMPLAMN